MAKKFIKQKNEVLKSTGDYFGGRGAQVNTQNRFFKHAYSTEHIEGIDEEFLKEEKTEYITTFPKTIINKVNSEDIGLAYSLNPYQGCEHGCIYCYARNTHEYWGYSAGIDFEQKIIIKQNVPEILEKHFSSKNWKPMPIMLSGNTDCYQPIERKLQITRKVLEICLKYKHPVSLITKNALVTRDIDVLKELAQQNLVHVMVSITGTDEKMRLALEPRTSTYKNRFKIVQALSSNKIPVGVMVAPVIPGLNSHEIPAVLKSAAEHGARTAGYTIVRLNGAIGNIFKDWLFKNFPDRADKVWNQICSCHNGNVNDSQYGRRMRGDGKISDAINRLFKVAKHKYLGESEKFEFNFHDFNFKAGDSQLSLF
ncbi:MAG TPA: PA0069 family radical SAM protein [Bacteroidia bacterium]|jgi:DNA repair photolyase|nr:PA0069 family radical SAM protein [Bacteroidia bacterium]